MGASTAPPKLAFPALGDFSESQAVQLANKVQEWKWGSAPLPVFTSWFPFPADERKEEWLATFGEAVDLRLEGWGGSLQSPGTLIPRRGLRLSTEGGRTINSKELDTGQRFRRKNVKTRAELGAHACNPSPQGG